MFINIRLPVIYKITNTVNGKVYIGQTVDFHRRVNEYVNRNPERSASSKYSIMEAIQKYGVDNFKFEIIHTCKDDNELNAMEYYYIELYKSYDRKYGYNSKHLSSDNVEVCNEDTRKRMSKSHTGLTETAATKRKKSKSIIAISDSDIIYCESAKLFGDYIGVSRAVVSHARRDCTRVKGYFVMSDPPEKHSKNTKNSDMYNTLVEFITNNDVETIKSRYNIEYIKYDE